MVPLVRWLLRCLTLLLVGPRFVGDLPLPGYVAHLPGLPAAVPVALIAVYVARCCR